MSCVWKVAKNVMNDMDLKNKIRKEASFWIISVQSLLNIV